MDPFSFQDEIMQLQDTYFSTFSPDPFALIPVTIQTNIQSSASVLPSKKERARCIAPCFVKYSRSSSVHVRSLEIKSTERMNVHLRVIEYLRKISKPYKPETEKRVNKKVVSHFQNRMKERLRREKISQYYEDLHKIILPRPKADKNSIVQSAATYLKELKTTKEDLYKQNKNLKERVDTENILLSKGLDLRTGQKIEGENMKIDEAKIKVQLMNPVSTIDSMIEALQCMKEMGVIAMSIQSKFSEDESTVYYYDDHKY